MDIILFDSENRPSFFPLSLNKSIADFRVGYFTIHQRWEQLLNAPVAILVHETLKAKYEPIENKNYLFVDATLLPTAACLDQIKTLKPNQKIVLNGKPVIYQSTLELVQSSHAIAPQYEEIENSTLSQIGSSVDIVNHIQQLIAIDFEILKRTTLGFITPTTEAFITDRQQVYIHPSADIGHCILNTKKGPIIIGEKVQVMDGCTLAGPLSIADSTLVKMGTTVYGSTSIGKDCIVGGEIKNSVLMDYSNKAHYGYLGDSVVGSWCNLGAGTSNSNIKNTAGEITVHNGVLSQNAGKKFGIVMGDYSRTAINTSLYTGSCVGICCHLFGYKIYTKHTPNFSWGQATNYNVLKAIEHIEQWMSLKSSTLTEVEKTILKLIFNS